MATKRSIFRKLKHIKRGTRLGNADNFITVDIHGTICILFCKSWARVMRQSHGTFRLHYNDLHLSSEKRKFCVHNGNRQH
jgi:hypothetical protein